MQHGGPESIATNPDIQELHATIKEGKDKIEEIDRQHKEAILKIQNNMQENLKKIDILEKSSDQGEYTDKFLYSYLDKLATNETFSKIFEIKKDQEHIYILS